MNALVKSEEEALAAKAGPAQAEQQQYLTFMLGSEMLSLSILRVKEIIWYANLTTVPMMPSCIRGVINLRGAVVPVLDLSIRFGRPPTPVTKSTCIVIAEADSLQDGKRKNVGIVVDAVQAVLEIPPTEIEPAPSFGTKIRSDFIEGIAKVNGKFVILLNVNQVLSVEELGTLDQAAAANDGATHVTGTVDAVLQE